MFIIFLWDQKPLSSNLQTGREILSNGWVGIYQAKYKSRPHFNTFLVPETSSEM